MDALSPSVARLLAAPRMPGATFATRRMRNHEVTSVQSIVRRQRRSERLLAEAKAAHGYLSSAREARNELITAVNLERACRSYNAISRGIAHGHLDPTTENQLLAAQRGLKERLFNVASAVAEL